MEDGFFFFMSGFMGEVFLLGEIIYFCYYGKVGSIIKLKWVVDEEEVFVFIKKDVEFDFLFEVFYCFVYKNGDD